MKSVVKILVTIGMLLLTLNVQAKSWETDFEKASEEAKESGKYILLDFSGSDWCGWCIKLEKEVFKKNDFKKYADDNLVCVLIDFPNKKRLSKKEKAQNAELAKRFGVRGYPTVIVLDSNGELAGRTGYQKGGPENYVSHLTEIISKHKASKK